MFIAANWKMNLSLNDVIKLGEIISKYKIDDNVDMCIFPQHPLIFSAIEKLKNFNIKIGSQSCHSNLDGSFTGDVSAQILSDLGCEYCIVGHSERRQYHNETNEFVKKTVDLLVNFNITPIICIGETYDLKQKKMTSSFIKKQLKECISNKVFSDIIIAYEPLWAIGTGIIPEPDEIFNVNDIILNEIPNIKNLKILYGGSVSLKNCSDIFKIKNIDGALIGNASLNLKDFLAIYETAVKQLNK